MIRPHRVNLLDLVAESHGLVNDELQKLVRCGFAGEERELAVHCAGPGDYDADCDLREGDEGKEGENA